jgi:hypothetical protein
LIRGFLSQPTEIDLASGKKYRHVPYAALKEDTGAFIPQQYRPANLMVKDPRNMHLEQIILLLRHCHQRQTDFGPESAFRFSLYKGHHHNRLFAAYPEPAGGEPNETPPEDAPKKKGRKKAKAKGKGKGKGKRKGKEKEQDITQLDGLLTISQFPSGLSTPGAASGSGSGSGTGPGWGVSLNTPAPLVGPSHSDDYIRIDWGQKQKLKDIGCDVFVQINGPNDGPPEYLVSSIWERRLEEIQGHHYTSDAGEHLPHTQNPVIDPSLLLLDHAVSVPPPAARPYPRPRPIFRGPTIPNIITADAEISDPSGLGGAGTGSAGEGRDKVHGDQAVAFNSNEIDPIQLVPTSSGLNEANEDRSVPSYPARAGSDAGIETISPVRVESDPIRDVPARAALDAGNEIVPRRSLRKRNDVNISGDKTETQRGGKQRNMTSDASALQEKRILRKRK